MSPRHTEHYGEPTCRLIVSARVSQQQPSLWLVKTWFVVSISTHYTLHYLRRHVLRHFSDFRTGPFVFASTYQGRDRFSFPSVLPHGHRLGFLNRP